MEDILELKDQNSGETELSPKLPSFTSKELLDTQIKSQQLQNEEKVRQRGLLGKLWGASRHSSNNIAGMLILLLLGLGFLYSLGMYIRNADDSHQHMLDFWDVITPLITMSLGYIFGHKV